MSEAKLFVGGLSWETTQESLKSYFEKFGAVTDATLKTDVETGKSRGFGFVTFEDPASVSQVLSCPEHKLDGRQIDPKTANPKGGREPVLKVFVGGLDPEVTEDEIRQHFGQYGTIDKVELPFDKVKQQRRAFCFVQFQTEDGVNNAVATNKQALGSREVDVKKATPQNDGFGGRGGGRGGFGGGRGGRGGRGGMGGGYGGAQGGGYGGYGGYGGGYGSGGGGYGGYGAGGGYGGNGYDSYGGSQKYSGYGAGDDSYGSGGYGGQQSWGGQTQSRGYHPYQR